MPSHDPVSHVSPSGHATLLHQPGEQAILILWRLLFLSLKSSI